MAQVAAPLPLDQAGAGKVGAAATGAMRTLLAATVALCSLDWPASAQQPTIDELQELIAAQQRQIEAQQQALEAQSKVLEQLQADVAALRATPSASEPVAAGAAMAQGTAATSAPVATPGRAPATVRSGEPRVQLTISGFANRAINVANDGQGTNVFFVDNQTSTSRVRLTGTAAVTEDLDIGAQLEIGIRPNSSNAVSQVNQSAGDSFDERIVEVFADSDRYGRLALGKGPNAADGAARVDLSGTTVTSYSNVANLAGGLLFVDGASGQLSSIDVSESFADYNGVRANRFRYDTPAFHGFRLAASAASNERYDVAVYWSGQNDTIQAAAAAGLQQPNVASVDLRYSGSASVLHKETGLNLTASVGGQSVDEGANPLSYFVKGGVIRDWLAFGSTALSIDYASNEDLPISFGAATSTDGQSVGAFAVQNVRNYGTEVYTGARWYASSPNGGVTFDDILVFTTGARVKF